MAIGVISRRYFTAAKAARVAREAALAAKPRPLPRQPRTRRAAPFAAADLPVAFVHRPVPPPPLDRTTRHMTPRRAWTMACWNSEDIPATREVELPAITFSVGVVDYWYANETALYKRMEAVSEQD
jgi:hypothetical protein